MQKLYYKGFSLTRLPEFYSDIGLIFAKLSPNFSFSWAEMVFILDLPHPPTHPDKYQNDQVELNL